MENRFYSAQDLTAQISTLTLKDWKKFSLEEFGTLSLNEKNKLFQGDVANVFHTLNAEQFDRLTLDRVYVLTNII